MESTRRHLLSARGGAVRRWDGDDGRASSSFVFGDIARAAESGPLRDAGDD